ncbi:hypothetical protein BaRGS_00016773 [Batillaria attramentaria]|uniref:Aminotransferase class I/classII large domain-containing protein n=1 Tax=Batillaria attramentaria TaxID=370345 RepID=A0ABD0KXI6_9CAEN
MATAPFFVDYDQHFSSSVKSIRQPALRKSDAYQILPGYIKMGGGFPNPSTFPILEADFTLSDGSSVHIDPKLMAVDLQYGMSEGNSDLREWLMKFQIKMHSPPTLRDPKHPGHFDFMLTNGSKEAINLILQQLLEEGDWALCEEATYATIMTMVLPIGAHFEGIKTDDQGIVPDDLERVLSTWNTLHPGTKKPRMIFVVTSAGNPTGVTWSLERKQAVYEIARSHDLLILEDDAYYYLQFSKPRVPSLLSMDVDGRVIRFDTLSKIVSPGLRVAMLSGPKPVLSKVRMQKDIGSLHIGGPTQALLLQLFRHWGQEGFVNHMDKLAEFYKTKAQTAAQYARKHLADLADWNPPKGGLFLWIRFHGVKDTGDIVAEALRRGLVVTSGRHFNPSNQDSPYIRVNYAVASEEELDKARVNAFRILAEITRDVTRHS